MTFKPKPIHRMAKCRKCPYHCRPCLTPKEAQAVETERAEAADRGEAWKATTVCQACHKKSNTSQNRWTYRKAGRDWDEENLTEAERLAKQIADLKRQIEALGG